ncbi:MAG: glycosyltransferase family 4 protein [Planctomycetota bacterium]
MFLNDRLSAAGGSERTLRAQILGLIQRGHAVHVVLPPQEVEACLQDPALQDVQWTRLESSAGFRSARVAAMRLAAVAREWNTDIIEVVNVGGLLGPMGVLHLERQFPVVHAFRDVRATCPRGDRVLPQDRLCEDLAGLRCLRRRCIEKDREPRGVRALVDSRLRLEALRQAPAVVAESEPMAALLRSLGVKQASITTPPLQVETPPLIAQLPSACAPVILGSGLLCNPTKGLSFLLDAFSRLQHPHARLALTGMPGKAWEDAWERFGHKIDCERIDVLGWLDDATLLQTIQSSRVAAFPSRFYESFGLAGAEASASARPVVAVDCKGSQEWLQDGVSGRLVARDHVEGFAAALDAYLEDPILADLHGQAGRAYMQQRFHPEALLDATLEVYQHVLASSPQEVTA